MHVAPEGLLVAHSVAEAFLFVSLAYCPKCQRRPIRPVGEIHRAVSGADDWRLSVNCPGCGQDTDLQFAIRPAPVAGVAVPINPLGQRSQIIDLAGWLTLFRTILDGAAGETDRGDARAMTLEAVQCLDEALRFYSFGEDTPDETAFFAAISLQRFRDHPEQFRRSRLLALKDRLPVSGSGRRTEALSSKKKWWHLW